MPRLSFASRSAEVGSPRAPSPALLRLAGAPGLLAVVMLVLSMTALTGAPSRAFAQDTCFKVADGFATGPGGAFFDRQLTVAYSGSGSVALAESCDRDPMFVDDKLLVDNITNGRNFQHDYSGGCSGTITAATHDISALLKRGRNTLRFTGLDVCLQGDSAISEIYIIGPFCPVTISDPNTKVIMGTSGDDSDLRGTRGDDVICGLGGDDLIDGRDGDDLIFPGGGDDLSEGGDGADEIQDEGGDDQLIGGMGGDLLADDGKRSERNILDGGVGRDELRAGTGKNEFRGGPGKDVMLGGDQARSDVGRTRFRSHLRR